MKRRLTTAVVAGSAALLLALTGCSGASTSSSSSSASAAPVPLTGYSTTDRGDIKDGGALTLPIDQAVVNFNPLNATDGTADTNTMSGLILPSLIELNADGSFKADPNYATSVKLVSTSPQVIDVKLNPKAVWSDGTPITSSDIKGTFAAQSGSNKKFELLSTAGYDQVQSVATPSPTEAKITFKAPYADWAGILTVVLPKALYDSPKGFNTAWKKAPTVSGGPFIFASQNTTQQVYTYKPNPKWWGDKPKLSQVVFRVINADSGAQSFANGEIDQVAVTDAASYATASKAAAGTMEQSGGLTWRHLTINGKNPILANANIRHAVALGINRTVIAQVMAGAVHAKPVTQDSLIYMPGQKGYTSTFQKALGNYSVAKAKQLIEAQGYTLGSNGYYAKSGKELKFSILIPASTPIASQVAQLIQNNMKAIGIHLTITSDQGDKFFTDIMKGNFDTTTFVWQGTAWPVSSMESLFYPANSGQNFGFITDKTLGADWTAANSQLNLAKQIQLAQAIDVKAMKLATIIPLAPRPLVWGVKKGLANYGPTMFLSTQWQNVGWKK